MLYYYLSFCLFIWYPNTDQEQKRPLRAESAADAGLQSRICREKRLEMPFLLLVDIGGYFFFFVSVSRTYFSCFSMYWELKSTFSSSQRGMWSDIWSIL